MVCTLVTYWSLVYVLALVIWLLGDHTAPLRRAKQLYIVGRPQLVRLKNTQGYECRVLIGAPPQSGIMCCCMQYTCSAFFMCVVHVHVCLCGSLALEWDGGGRLRRGG